MFIPPIFNCKKEQKLKMKKLIYCLFVFLIIISSITISNAEENTNEDSGWICFGGNATVCSQAYVRCVGQYGGQMDPEGSGSTLCEARYQNCLESGGGCLPIY